MVILPNGVILLWYNRLFLYLTYKRNYATKRISSIFIWEYGVAIGRPILVDNFARTVDYLRLSVTDRCDFRCQYCMAEDMEFLPRAEILTLEECATIAEAFVALGVRKIRITGGEPLVRRGLLELLGRLGQIDGLELVLTTNGSRLQQMAQDLKACGVSRVNISLDTLDADKFKRITRTGSLATVLSGITAAKQAGFANIKINAVILKNHNHQEVLALAQYAISQQIDISYIEEMPLGITEHDRTQTYYSNAQVLADLSRHLQLLPSLHNSGGPAVYYQLANSNSKIGFISPHSANFCASCNRVRVTAQGRLLLCLGNEHSLDLKSIIRAHPNDTDRLQQAIIASMQIKPRQHHFNINEQPIIMRHMSATGG